MVLIVLTRIDTERIALETEVTGCRVRKEGVHGDVMISLEGGVVVAAALIVPEIIVVTVRRCALCSNAFTIQGVGAASLYDGYDLGGMPKKYAIEKAVEIWMLDSPNP